MKTILRLALGAAALAAALGFDVPASHAFGEAPWCAVMPVGAGDLIWDCEYNSVEACAPNVIAGNRGFCNENPAWQGVAPRAEVPRHHRRRHARRD
jgi:Protein of unknown function (DUF3551)